MATRRSLTFTRGSTLAGRHAAIAYGLCQAAGWSAWAAVNLLFFGVSSGGVTARATIRAIAVSLVGFAISHAYRAVVRRQRWALLGLVALAPRVVGASIVEAVVMLAGVVAISRALPSAETVAMPTSALVLFLFNFSVVFLGWSLIYFGVHFLERSRRAERAELQHLRSQLNPHFLFNALNGIRALISEDPARAQAAVTRLANLMRVALGSANADTVPLEREIEVARDYLELEAMRFEERLAVRVDVSDEARRVPVPSMIVQTLVENGIKHGIARRPSGGEIDVRARVRGGVLEIDVTNTAADELSTAAKTSSGVGLANATERLELLFGRRASLRLNRADAGRTTAEVRIPIP